MKSTHKMKFLSGLFLAATLLLTACGNKQDFAYNEKITHDFYSCKERLDETHQKLLGGGFDLDKSNQISFESDMKNLSSVKKFVNETKTTADELEHSEAANAFHANIMSYMTKLGDEYLPMIENYANEQDSTKRIEIKQNLIAKKSELEDLENKSLDSQIEFLNKAGIKINPNQ